MNNWIYLILIAVLAILAVVMLYSRFVERSREKSFHHAPAKIMFSAETISAAHVLPPEATLEIAPDEPDASIPLARVESSHETLAENYPVGKEKSPESDYLDELQEAAAGLALLMRSSPVGRVSPVVFAPESDSAPVVDEAGIESENGPEIPASTEELPESAVPFEDSDPESGEIQPASIREVLGEQVFEAVGLIDLELDSLEMLVAGIEASLLTLGSPGLSGEVDALTGETDQMISEAA